MQKAESQHGQTQHQPVAKQAKAASVESPQGEHIAQLEAMMDSSPQAEKLGGLAAMMNASPAMVAQRKLADMMHNSPRQVAQKKAFDAIHNSPHQTAQRKKFDNLFGTAQRVGEEEPLQHKLASDSPAQLEQQPAQLAPAEKRPNNTGLPDNLKSGIENLSGMSMDSVKVHYNSSQPAQLNALAYAQGTDIHVAPGQEQHLPHEAWHVVQQAQGRVQPTMQMKGGVPVNDDKGLEHEADVMGVKALQLKIQPAPSEPAKIAAGMSLAAPVQCRVSVNGWSIVTPQNKNEIDEYIFNKQKYDQAEENKNAARNKQAPREILSLKKLYFEDLIKPITYYHKKFSPPCSLKQIIELLSDWANAQAPSEVKPDKRGVLPLVSTQDNQFESVQDLFLKLVQNIRAEQSRLMHEKASFEVLAHLDQYLPLLTLILTRIDNEITNTALKKSVLTAGYAKNILGDIVSGPVNLPEIILSQRGSLIRLFLSINTIHTFLIKTKQLAVSERKVIKAEMGDRHDKYSPFGPEIDDARKRGFAVWSGFSGSTADILNLAVKYNLPPNSIHQLAVMTAAFFQFLPTSVNPTHTFHEVMAVANKFFNVPYNPENPSENLPHRTVEKSSSASTSAPIKRVGKLGPDVAEVDLNKLFWLHNVPRQGTPEGHIGNLAAILVKVGFDVDSPVSATLLPNGDYLVTGGHHRIAAMKQLGEKTIPIKKHLYSQTPPVFLARMLGIARITGKYFDLWSPALTDEQREAVNSYLKKWMGANSDQVRYKFIYQKELRLSKL